MYSNEVHNHDRIHIGERGIQDRRGQASCDAVALARAGDIPADAADWSGLGVMGSSLPLVERRGTW